MKFVTLALESTDTRIKAGKSVSPGFLFASLLWHQVLEKWTAYRVAGEAPIPALHLAADDVLDNQTDKLALQRRIATDMRDIWAMQPRFERRTGKAPYKLLEHPRFRAGFDFLLLRCESGELDAEIGTWWTGFYAGDISERERLLTTAREPQAAAPKKRARRRAPRREGEVSGEIGGEAGAESGAEFGAEAGADNSEGRDGDGDNHRGSAGRGSARRSSAGRHIPDGPLDDGGPSHLHNARVDLDTE
jgi:poly(A) polymerase